MFLTVSRTNVCNIMGQKKIILNQFVRKALLKDGKSCVHLFRYKFQPKCCISYDRLIFTCWKHFNLLSIIERRILGQNNIANQFSTRNALENCEMRSDLIYQTKFSTGISHKLLSTDFPDLNFSIYLVFWSVLFCGKTLVAWFS